MSNEADATKVRMLNDWVYGCANFGGIGTPENLIGKGDSEEEALRNCDEALELGLTRFDTANTYAGGASEMILGKWLKAMAPSRREQITIASKVGNKSSQVAGGLSRKHIQEQIELSLKRLGRDHLDIYFLHLPDPSIPLEETLQCFHELRLQGKIKNVGAANVDLNFLQKADEICSHASLTKISFVQNPFSLIRRNRDLDLLNYCKCNHIEYWAYGPLEGGLLSGKYTKTNGVPTGSRIQLRNDLYGSALTPDFFEKISATLEIADTFGVNTATLVYSWLLAHPQSPAAIVAPRNAAQFSDLRATKNLKLLPEDLRQLEKIWS